MTKQQTPNNNNESKETKTKEKTISEKKIDISETKKEKYIEITVNETKKIKIELSNEKEIVKISIETEQRNLEKEISKNTLSAILTNSIKIRDIEILSEKSLKLIKKEGISSFPLILARLIPKSENIPKEIFESSKQALKSIELIKKIYSLKNELPVQNTYIEAYMEEFLKAVEKLTKIENPYKNSNKSLISRRFLLSKKILGYAETIKIIRKIENLTNDPATILKILAYSLSIRNKNELSDVYNFIHIDTTDIYMILSILSDKLPTKTFVSYQIPFTPHKEEKPKKIFSEEFITKSIYATIIKHYISNTYKPVNIVFDQKELRMKIGNTGVYFKDKAEYLQAFYSLYIYEKTGIFTTKTSADSKIINYHYVPVINGKFLDQNTITGEELLSKDTKSNTKFLLFIPHIQVIEKV